jgi:hypothetical protein
VKKAGIRDQGTGNGFRARFCGFPGLSFQISTPRTKTAPWERRIWGKALFARLAFLAAAQFGCGLPRLVAAMVPLVVGQCFGDFFLGKVALAAKMQNIV